MKLRYVVLGIASSMAGFGCGLGTILSILDGSYTSATWWFTGGVASIIVAVIVVIMKLFPQEKEKPE